MHYNDILSHFFAFVISTELEYIIVFLFSNSYFHSVNFGCYRMLGPEMPSAELLAAAAKLTEAEAEMRYCINDIIPNGMNSPPPFFTLREICIFYLA